MSFNSLGQFIINSAGQPVVAGTTITSTAFNLLTADLATGLSTAICKDGQTTITANIPMSGFKLTGLPVATVTGDALSYGRNANVAALVATSVTTLNGSFSLPQLTATTFTALASTGTGTWLVSCQFQIADAVNFGQLAVVVQDSGNLAVTNLMSGSHMQISASGLNLQATNNFASGTLTASWSYIRIAT